MMKLGIVLLAILGGLAIVAFTVSRYADFLYMVQGK